MIIKAGNKSLIIDYITTAKKLFGIDEMRAFGDIYLSINKEEKGSGAVYTPLEISSYMVKNTITAEALINNPYIRIIDPACGTGNLLRPFYDELYSLYMENVQAINNKNVLSLNPESIPEHICKFNLEGYDIDDFALKILSIDLFNKSGFCPSNIFNKDFLFLDETLDVDIIISNPPYIGHKAIGIEYGRELKKSFSSIYLDKGDISYCFFYKALEQLKHKGKITIITSRYFIESPSGRGLRKLLKDNFKINKIVDFYGIRPFKNIGIDPVILFLEKENVSDFQIKVIKPRGNTKKVNFISGINKFEETYYKEYFVEQSQLIDDGWRLIDEREKTIVDKIEANCKVSLDNISDSFQGIITGCDKAFIVNKDTIETCRLEKDIIKPWIKSSFIKNDKVNLGDSYLLYTNLIDDENKYNNTLSHLSDYKDKLLQRRECRSGKLSWYQLQWGRKSSIFEGEKIIFPYKGEKNNFVYDKGSYFSADIYSLILKEGTGYTYDFLIFILNSKLYNFYFKTFGKKLGEKMYEYYPSYISKIMVPEEREFASFTEDELYRYFGLSEDEVELINGYN